ncbi:Rad52/Rad22 family DNA repair protein [Bacillus cihuensis]|uniref:Rad52/Rad22 family DNA repair protein n=1 Tax=Bacillus cihuensis TaxID=1208599 RepID=UPI00042280BA|nr:Rad52/Rad22 family DNA repair protein [Bacillus cihuensis]
MSNHELTTGEIMERLAAPFKSSEMEWRVQSATENNGQIKVLVLPYIDSRAVMNRLDQVLQVNWQTKFFQLTVAGKEAFQCQLSIKIGDEWISRTDGAEASDIESVKGGHSNALKRAATQWGIGRYLYDLPSQWVPLFESKQSGKKGTPQYVNGEFKVKGVKKRLTGYFYAPEVFNTNGGMTGNPDNNQAPRQNNNNQSNPSNGKPSQQSKANGTAGKSDRHEQALLHVNNILDYLDVPFEYIPRLLKKATNCTLPYQKASPEQLGDLYKVLSPVKDYIVEAQKYDLNEEELLNYAQIVVKEPLNNIYALFFNLTREKAIEAINIIKGDREGNHKAS